MQIDFHHAVTYVIARTAGFSQAEANTIAYAAQYVDDSVTSGFIQFNNGMRYQRFATAHPVYDYENVTDNDENSLSWLPFHFLPGNDGKKEGEPVSAPYPERLICRQDSHVARAMMASVIATKGQPWGLHRLGIAAHVFADTFAHKGFVGLAHLLNQVGDDIVAVDGAELGKNSIPPVGHGQVDTYPDRPYLSWKYKNHNDELVIRDNPIDFVVAVKRLYEEFVRFRKGDPFAVVDPMPEKALAKIQKCLLSFQSDDEKERHQQWLEAIKANAFGFGSEVVVYKGAGANGWKHQALGDKYAGWLEKAGCSIKDKLVSAADLFGIEMDEEYDFNESFLISDYKLFHDAAKFQRYDVLCNILPRFGIQAA